MDELADVLKLRRRKQVSDEERERLRRMSQKHSPFLRDRFSESDRRVPESPIGDPSDPVAVAG